MDWINSKYAMQHLQLQEPSSSLRLGPALDKSAN